MAAKVALAAMKANEFPRELAGVDAVAEVMAWVVAEEPVAVMATDLPVVDAVGKVAVEAVAALRVAQVEIAAMETAVAVREMAVVEMALGRETAARGREMAVLVMAPGREKEARMAATAKPERATRYARLQLDCSDQWRSQWTRWMQSGLQR